MKPPEYSPLPRQSSRPASACRTLVRHLGDAHSARLAERRASSRVPLRRRTFPLHRTDWAVTPVPTRLVPLLMALRLDPVRLLIADDVGVGKTIEAAPRSVRTHRPGRRPAAMLYCAHRISLSNGKQSYKRSSTSTPSWCWHPPPDSARAWSRHRRVDLRALPQRDRVDRLHQVRPPPQTISFSACPELVIVDEAHACARSDERTSAGRHQRHALVTCPRQPDADRHHGAGHRDARTPARTRRSVRCLGCSTFGVRTTCPSIWAGEANRRITASSVARHLVQRRRSEIQDYLGTLRPRSLKRSEDRSWQYDPVGRVPDAVRSSASPTREAASPSTSRGTREQRVRQAGPRWDLLRALASSPVAAAAAKTLQHAGTSPRTTLTASRRHRRTRPPPDPRPRRHRGRHPM